MILLLCFQSILIATDQVPDTLYYNGKVLLLRTGWGHPSPLQTYFSQNQIVYPFKMLGTANYRGHQAVWDIQNNKVYLRYIYVGKERHTPAEYKIVSKQGDSVSGHGVSADWFSGVIESEEQQGDEVLSSFYFHVKYGRIRNIQEITPEDYERVQNISAKDTTDIELMNKYRMLYLNFKYLSYYFRLESEDSVIIDGRGGYINGPGGLSPIMQYYYNDHTAWPYNWENKGLSGAPHCTWLFKNNTMFLTKLTLYTGLDFEKIDKHPVELRKLFADKVQQGRMMAERVSGIYMIKFGEFVLDKVIPDYQVFEVSDYKIIRITNGTITESYAVEKDFNFKNPPAEAPEGLLQILKEIK